MSILLTEKCPVCSAPVADSQKWQRTKTTSLRSTDGKRNTLTSNFNRTSLTQQSSTGSSIRNLENDYIKQLQEQIYYLETECLYLREQANKNSSLLTRSVNDDRVYKAEQERSDLQRSLVQTSSQFDQLSSEKHGLTIALDQLREKFDIEKQNLLDEMDMLRRARETFETEKRARDEELRQIRDRSRLSSDELKNAQAKIRLLEQQLDQQSNQNRDVSEELRQLRLESNTLQRSLNDSQLAMRERDRLQGIVNELQGEMTNLRKELKANDARFNDTQLLRNKLADEKGALMKEVTRLETLAKDFERELDQLRHSLRDRADTLQSKDRDLAALRKKEQSFHSAIESIQSKLDAEMLRNKDLEGQITKLQRQLNLESQNSSSSKRELSEYQLRNTRLQDEINGLQREREQSASLISSLQQRLAKEEDLTRTLHVEIEELETRVSEIDRLKSLEDLIQSQRWDDISQMAQTMQSVSRTMARATSPNTTMRRRVELQ